jgi:hypothetical protein
LRIRSTRQRAISAARHGGACSARAGFLKVRYDSTWGAWCRRKRRPMSVHKFHLGQPVEYWPSRGIYAPRGPYVVTAKLPERDGEFEYHIRHMSEQHERLARESELTAWQNAMR